MSRQNRAEQGLPSARRKDSRNVLSPIHIDRRAYGVITVGAWGYDHGRIDPHIGHGHLNGGPNFVLAFDAKLRPA